MRHPEHDLVGKKEMKRVLGCACMRTLVGSAILVLLDHLFLLCSTNNLSALRHFLSTFSFLTSHPHHHLLFAMVSIHLTTPHKTLAFIISTLSRPSGLPLLWLASACWLHASQSITIWALNLQNEQRSGHQKSVALTATALSLIIGLAGSLLPSSNVCFQFSQSAASAPGNWGTWGVAVMMYATIDHLSLTEALKSARDSDSGSDDILSFIIIRMLSCELAGTLAFDHPLGNMSDRLVGMISYLGRWTCPFFCTAVHPAFHTSFKTPTAGISSIAPSSDAFKLTAPPPRQLNPFLKMSRFIKRARSVINTILLNPESRNIFFFLCLNLAFMLIQMTYGIWTNSLGLISDCKRLKFTFRFSIHMFFDCMALGMGLFASVMATWPADKQFTYGYGRVETLSGFANGVFLMLISTFIVFEAVQRLVDPPEMNTNQLLTVSFIGLMVNLVGMFATGHHHHHGHSHDHDHDHGHSHNMKGVFLHVMADTLGSVGVIISTLLIERYGWTGFDPIASIFIAVLIFASVVPLVQDSAKILMLCLDDEREKQVRKALGKLSTIEGLSSYSAPRFWPQDSSTIAGSLHLQISPLASQPESSTTSFALGSPVMMLEEQEELFACYGHAELVKKRVEQSLATSIPGLTELTIQVEGIDGSKNCFCLTGPNC
ncbi:uncharacterized protein VP01_1525g4 [Puccinia sorghi]|uniref:Cation efflux protein transmembrane domain-containing protein n=1 Tax=Puccinia sorghi TaxID=27349 RepID=A0A0L6VIR1_9BASI|nr:uncharacterized protein VP01_1525g4 [Puccinia sorghi]